MKDWRSIVFSAQFWNIPNLPPIKDPKPSARIVELVVNIGVLSIKGMIGREDPQAMSLRFLHHPFESDKRHALFRVPATHVGVRAGKPHLLNSGRIFRVNVPENRRK